MRAAALCIHLDVLTNRVMEGGDIMRRPCTSFILIFALLANSTPAAWAGHHRRGGGCGSGCNDCAPACAPQCNVTYKTVEKTVMVPTWVNETKTVNVVECRAEQREKTVNVCRQVTETQQVSRE